MFGYKRKIIEVLEDLTMAFDHCSCTKRELEAAKRERNYLAMELERVAEQNALLKKELEEERYRHDRLQDFEVAEAKELEKLKAENAVVWSITPEENAAQAKYEAHLYIEDLLREIMATGQAIIPDHCFQYLAVASKVLSEVCDE